MRIAAKLNIGILAVFAASVLANFLVLQATIKPKFYEIEMAAAKLNHKRVLDALDTLQGKLRSSTQDWAFWDDSYDYARGVSVQHFMDSNLSSPTMAFDALGIEMLAFFDPRGSLLWGEAIDNSTKREIPGFVEEVKALGYRHPYLSGVGDAKSVSGLIKTSRGVMLVAAAPIIKTDQSGAPVGTIWMGSFLDAQGLQELTGVNFRLEENIVNFALKPEETVSTVFGDTISTSALITDILGRPLVVLHADTPRDVSTAGAVAIRSATWLSVAAVAVVLFAHWLIVNAMVISRVAALKQHFATAGANGQIRRTELDQSTDEIGQLAKSFNAMAEQVNQLRDALLSDSAHLCQLSEWATGTLHNVRNGLIPINVASWRSHLLFETPSMANVKRALEELRCANTSTEKREKLSAYVLSKVTQMLDSAEEVKVMSKEIMSASKALEDMVSGYEQFSRRQVVLEQIDLLPLIENVAKSTVAAHDADVQLTLPSTSKAIVGNRTLLRQILANVLTNAFEAMDGQQSEKRIRVEIHDAEAGIGDLRLSISDNGEGIAPDDLETIFEHGFSTRCHKIGGLGLHWCANAAKALGGCLTAESNGPGTGATIVLRLPKSKPTRDALKEAA